MLTHSFELLFELRLVLAVGNAEVVVGIVVLEDDIGGSGSADGEHSCGAFGPLSSPDLLELGGHHSVGR